MPYPNPADIEAMKSDPDINLLQQEGLNVGYLAYNTQEPPFDNVKVREALNMAINKQAIIDAVFQGAGKVDKNRSEERRVGNECVSTCRSRWTQKHEKKKKQRKQ